MARGISAGDHTLYLGSGNSWSYTEFDPLAFHIYTATASPPLVLHVRPDRQRPALAPVLPPVGHATWRASARRSLARLPQSVPLQVARRRHAATAPLSVGDVGWNTREEVDLIGTPGRTPAGPATRARCTRRHLPGRPEVRPGVRQGGHRRRARPAGLRLPPHRHERDHRGPDLPGRLVPGFLRRADVLRGLQRGLPEGPQPRRGRRGHGHHRVRDQLGRRRPDPRAGRKRRVSGLRHGRARHRLDQGDRVRAERGRPARRSPPPPPSPAASR